MGSQTSEEEKREERRKENKREERRKRGKRKKPEPEVQKVGPERGRGPAKAYFELPLLGEALKLVPQR